MCVRCCRQLLTGEEFRYWRSLGAERDGFPVCALCERDAQGLGWKLAERPPDRENAVGLRGTVRPVG